MRTRNSSRVRHLNLLPLPSNRQAQRRQRQRRLLPLCHLKFQPRGSPSTLALRPARTKTCVAHSADPSQSGLTNLEAYNLKVDPNNPADDGCGLANGDVVHVFNLDITDCHTGGSPTYTDVQDLNNHYDSHTGQPFTPAQLTQIAANIKQYGLHSPTTATLSQPQFCSTQTTCHHQRQLVQRPL